MDVSAGAEVSDWGTWLQLHQVAPALACLAGMAMQRLACALLRGGKCMACAPADAHAWSLLSGLQVVDRSETEVTCVATNSATLDGLLNVMVCHTEVSGRRCGKPARAAGDLSFF